MGLLTEDEAHEAAALYDELRRAPLDINAVREEGATSTPDALGLSDLSVRPLSHPIIRLFMNSQS